MSDGKGSPADAVAVPKKASSIIAGTDSGSNDSSDGERPEPGPMSVSSDEVNFLVYRYLQESGFVHSAFTFAYESLLGRSHIRNAEKTIPPGALISFLQKGLQYVGIEESLRREEEDKDKKSKGQKNNKVFTQNGDDVDFTLLAPQSINALTRERPPIVLNVPPAAAAACVKARLEAEAKLDADAKAAAVKAVTTKTGKVTSIPSQQSVEEQQRGLSKVNAAQSDSNTSTAQTSTISHMQQRGGAPNVLSSAFTVQQQRMAEAQLAAFQQQQQELVNRSSQQAGANDSTQAAAAALAFVAQQQQQHQHQKQQQQQQLLQKQQEQLKLQQQNQEQHHYQQQQMGQQGKISSKGNATTDGSSSETAAVLEALHTQNAREAVQRMVEEKAQNDHSGKTTPMELDSKNSKQIPSNRFVNGLNATSPVGMEQNGALAAAIAARQGSHGVMVNGQNDKMLSAYHQQHNLHHHRHQQQQHLHQQQYQHHHQHIQQQYQQQQRQRQMEEQQTQSQTADRQSAAAPAPVAEDPETIDKEDMVTQAKSTEVLELNQHSSEVFMCAWNPVFTDLIATGSGDASARIWQMGGANAADGCGPVRELPHGTDMSDRKNKDVTTLEWSSDGKLLATGSYDGVARVWSRTGALVHTLSRHRGPIFSLKWNRSGNYLLSGSYDQTTIVWDVSGGEGQVVQQFKDHNAPALDVDWKDDDTFASCSTDKRVLICRVGEENPLRVYAGHMDEVNAVKWDPSGTLLASCSDDYTAKVWNVASEQAEPMYDFKDHKAEIYTLKWSPTGPGSMNPQKQKMLATASFDGSVRLWNVQDGTCIRVFSRHRDSVYSVAFSPSGDYLASGSLAGQLYIWNVLEGVHVKSFKGKGDIFEVAWNVEESRVAACFSSNVVSVIDFKP
mmetsp:Transcript_30661/g.45369  ORF Transcript_30661/g.45369 Transcript_30661/m.45369 type:complete len:897 (+) Transcript_30661:81-2771(+)|eukprot:CAMPEP_0194216148 /NCGR_PEP_ID=MMETSP0156-20130528/18400_1 /TAXON_ID=33649 /ORGANISM="Thalassionema nitzschioides, Strain L26-B" /LENGTH=896 /DNA_ID=CAMNT_0038944847 /DNA_START=60 /DNA_END=2750 /DNA_ORIENTATION=-